MDEGVGCLFPTQTYLRNRNKVTQTWTQRAVFQLQFRPSSKSQWPDCEQPSNSQSKVAILNPKWIWARGFIWTSGERTLLHVQIKYVSGWPAGEALVWGPVWDRRWELGYGAVWNALNPEGTDATFHIRLMRITWRAKEGTAEHAGICCGETIQKLARSGQYIHDTRLYKQMKWQENCTAFVFPASTFH